MNWISLNVFRIFARACACSSCNDLQEVATWRWRRTQDMSDEFAEPELLDPFSAAEIAAQSVLEQERLAWAPHERISRIFKILQLLQDLLHFYAVVRSVDSTRFDLGAKVGRSTACVEQEVLTICLKPFQTSSWFAHAFKDNVCSQVLQEGGKLLYDSYIERKSFSFAANAACEAC